MMTVASHESFSQSYAWGPVNGPMRLPAPGRSSRWRATRGIILDLDNTLYPLSRYMQSGFAAVAAHVAARFGVPQDASYALLTRCAVRGRGKTAFQTLCRRFHLGSETVPVLLDVFRAHRPSIFLGQPARELLTGLRSSGWRTVVLTNGLPAVQALKANALDLESLVDDVLYAEQLAPGGKPAPAAFAEALRRLGTRAHRTVCVGDDPHCDIAGARAAGIATVRLATTVEAVALDIEADIVVIHLDEVRSAASLVLEGVTSHAA